MSDSSFGPCRMRFTEIMCPNCGNRTGVSVRDGNVLVYCRKCALTIDVTIRREDTQPTR